MVLDFFSTLLFCIRQVIGLYEVIQIRPFTYNKNLNKTDALHNVFSSRMNVQSLFQSQLLYPMGKYR